MKFLFIIYLYFFLLPIIYACPIGEYSRVTKYGPRGPYLLCHPIPQGTYICGQTAEATYSGYINVDRLCKIGNYLKRGRPLVHPGISVRFKFEEHILPPNEKPCGQEKVLLYNYYSKPELIQYGYQTKLCQVFQECKRG